MFDKYFYLVFNFFLQYEKLALLLFDKKNLFYNVYGYMLLSTIFDPDFSAKTLSMNRRDVG